MGIIIDYLMGLGRTYITIRYLFSLLYSMDKTVDLISFGPFNIVFLYIYKFLIFKILKTKNLKSEK